MATRKTTKKTVTRKPAAGKALETPVKEVQSVTAKAEATTEVKAEAPQKEKAKIEAIETKAGQAKAIETKKDTTKAIETRAAVLKDPEPVKDPEPAKDAEETPAKKAAPKKAAAKKPAAKKEELKTEIFLQFDGREYAEKDILKMVKDIWTKELKNKVGDMKDVKIYLKPEESAAYYVVNGDTTGKVDL